MAVLQPFLTMLVFTLFFGRLAHLPSGDLPYPVFYCIDLVPRVHSANAVTTATNTRVENQEVIIKGTSPGCCWPRLRRSQGCIRNELV